jgi:hypothetical protein
MRNIKRVISITFSMFTTVPLIPEIQNGYKQIQSVLHVKDVRS